MPSDSPPPECASCGTEYEPTYDDCPNCGKGFLMPPVMEAPACENCGEPFDERRYECPDCGTNVATTI